MKNHNSGFIALISAIIISVLLLVITVTVSMTGILARFSVLDAESKERSIALAEACADNAILKLATNIDYALLATDHNIPVGSDTCDIVSISPAPPRSGLITIKTQGIFNKAYTNIKAVIDSDDFTISSWGECANMSSC